MVLPAGGSAPPNRIFATLPNFAPFGNRKGAIGWGMRDSQNGWLQLIFTP
jgi:hypothetical protein